MRRAEKYVSAVVLAAFLVANNARAYYVSGQLSPENFNKMYALASHGEVASLREAVNRGLNIDSLNSEGDTGVCTKCITDYYLDLKDKKCKSNQLEEETKFCMIFNDNLYDY